ncbi:MAG: S41 family peptidase, partial [Abditibacteriales bacterium]|nr:S41 family peptidase [Abditibacteriales bacterium]
MQKKWSNGLAVKMSYIVVGLLQFGVVVMFSFCAGYGLCSMVTGDNAKPASHPLSPIAKLVQSKGAAVPAYEPDMKPYETINEVMRAIREHFIRTDVKDRDLTYGAIDGMLKSLGDRFTRFMRPEEYEEFEIKNQGEFYGIGAHIDVILDEKTGKTVPIIIRTLEGTPAEKAGIRAEDRILKIDGKSTEDMASGVVVSLIRGKQGTPVTLTILHKGETKPVDITIVRDRIELHPVTYEMLPGRIGYIKLQEFNEKGDRELDKAFARLKADGAKGLIFDVRSNPGGLLEVAISVASRFIKSGPVVSTKDRKGNIEKIEADPDRFLNLKIPVVVLVNKYSASASEILAGAVQDTGVAKVVGEKTFGKASVQILVKLRHGGAVALTTAKYLTPKNRDISELGITPDEIVPADETDRDNGSGTGKGAQFQRA